MIAGLSLVLWMTCAEAALGAVSFAPHQQYPGGDVDSAVGALDADNDGDLDLVALGDQVQLLTGDGSGSFGSPTSLSIGTSPRALTVADFNRNGRADLALSDSSEDKVRVLLTRRAGGFTQKEARKVNAAPLGVAHGDFDGDGKRDLASSAFGASVKASSLFGRGDGTFSRAKDVPVGESSEHLAVGDLDGNGRSDLALPVADGVLIRYGKADRGFRRGGIVATGQRPFAIAIADFDRDGRRDVAVTNTGSGINDGVTFLFRKRRGFTDPLFVATGEVAPQSVTIADFNRDGKPDVATGNVADSVSVIENLGDRTFAAAVAFQAGDEVQAIVAARLDGDRKPDLATANNNSESVSVLINDL